MTAVDQRDAWTKQNIGYLSRMPRHFPTEYLLRSLCSRGYFALGKEKVPGHKVLDLGCLYLNNLMTYAVRALNLNGVEIHDDMVAVATARAAALGPARTEASRAVNAWLGTGT